MSVDIDTTGLSCPQPMLLVKQALEKTDKDLLVVLADCEASRENITRLSRQLGWQVHVVQDEEGIFTLQLQKNA